MDFEDLNFEKRPYSAVRAYMQSKLANILFTKELTRKLAGLYKIQPHTYTDFDFDVNGY